MSDMPETGFRSRSERKKKKNTTLINGVLAAAGLAVMLFALFFVMYPFDKYKQELASGLPSASPSPTPTESQEASASPLPSSSPSPEPTPSSEPDEGYEEPTPSPAATPSEKPTPQPTEKPEPTKTPGKPSAKPTAKPNASGSASTYIVKEGDTLTSISINKYGSKDYVSLIAEENGIVFVNDMKPGDKLKLPPSSSKPPSKGDTSSSTNGTKEIDYSKVKLPATYFVLPGDTFYRISVRFYGTGKHADRIAEINSLDADAGLKAGESITIPAKPAK
ncbi:LysM peptidoglycan-binding domain-containing protein [Paenibacillus pasadenensis]|uniref:LysM peptidoglycan-binding domain-containing protein n=1 Tax=Paenibacillus pasadenensis TaxID=217090 RepID=UPI0020409A94|nr:LysM peptidoglycan-binding domain-containing protein [Paenibacillus pasadenensis]MCM3748875.1 LysM peptidoglycan-binding domain-containing protein [Paenibacillus pasadenensis]